MDIKLQLPNKIVSYLRRLKIEYDQREDEFFSNIVGSAKVFVREPSIIYGDFGGVRHDYDIVFFLPVSVMEEIDLRKQKSYREEIRKDLERCKDIEDEFFENVFFSCENENDEECRQAVSLNERPRVDPETLNIWKPGLVRLFISHRATHKKEARELADALEAYGISSFVAHEAIEPMATWKDEILKGLETMESMLTFITDDFHESVWANQEIGFALARDVPILSLKLENSDPEGFIASEQALRGTLKNPAGSAPQVYKLLQKKLRNKSLMQSALITVFVEPPSWYDTQGRFDRLNDFVETLSEEEVERIIQGFKNNSQLNACYYLTDHNRLINFLERTTGKEYSISGKIIELSSS